jgi:aryl-alcohol dehydrogenase-like predicted oxidoreductase
MQYRQLGATGLSLSAIAFGCGGNAGLMLRASAAEQEAAVARALELGITYFDNAPDYGDGVAEENLGRALKSLKVRPLLNSKVEIRAANLQYIADHVVASCEASLRRLGVDCLDIFQIHNGPSAADPGLSGKVYTQLASDDFVREGGAIDGIERLKRAGKIRVAGFICRGDDGQEVRRMLDTNAFGIINVPYTLLNPTAGMPKPPGFSGKDFGNVIAAAAERGAGSAIYAPLAGGWLTDDALQGAQRHPLARAVDPQGDAAQKNRVRAKAVSFIAREHGVTLAQAAYRFVLSHPQVTTALGGYSSIAQMEEICAVSDMAEITLQDREKLLEVWSQF